MAFNTDPVLFSVSVEGDTTLALWTGDFQTKPFLTHRDRLRADQFRRELLGTFSDGVSTGAANRSLILSQLFVRLVKAPDWWTNSNNGLDLYDDNLIVTIHEKCEKIEEEALKKLREEATKAREEIKESLSDKKK